ncbi:MULTISPECIES: NAD(P)-binding protein [Gordonia]|uniref:NAD(P)-binding protein n=1 Tax=Gordonia amicalis TaxID=89053 RepID=A0AAE4R2L0_9ACTN|nr:MULTISPECIES: NAD(P)-binding protein [Gordonia]MCZ4577763.1 NAD(P)-binding protein [Gordonia amicalis]MCZ4651393.1 NAD(P)-binding protein [Gordonia amicalis]MDJ0451242.1 NAD(P)-binding protein [Gordonia amicalis]MDV6310587.1 NAD(P)-binding protein [Gordonia amicalis]MDV7074624.1 NAD(P)-binding protein [Gordonia amicalis]
MTKVAGIPAESVRHRYPHVFEPLQLGSVTIPNRIVRTAHTTHQPLTPGGGLAEYHLERARGGVGLSILGAASVHPSAAMELAPYDPATVPAYSRLMSRIERYPMRLMQQLWHPGSAAHANALGGPMWSAGDVPNPVRGLVPIPMTQTMIDDVVEGFAVSARHVREGGLHGVEIHAGHNYLVSQFLSPVTNNRTDDYGGCEENRLRFLREIVAAIRQETGADFPIGVRLSSDEDVPGGNTPADARRIAEALGDSVDFVDASFGGYYRFVRMMATGDGYPLGYELPASEQVTRGLAVPTIVTGRIMTLDDAERVLASGQADMVSMVRALIADPEIVRKTVDGREAEIRPCIGTNEGCVAGRRGTFGCVVNPVAGKEVTWTADPSPAPRAKRVLVGGGGPAGMEAARAAALRGHDVELLEMTRQLGGQVAIGAAAPHRSDYGAHVRWLADELTRLGVRIRLGVPLEPDIVSSLAPDVVIVAVGASPRTDGFTAARPAFRLSTAARRRVRTSWEVLGFGGRIDRASRVVVYDDDGDFEAISVVESLLDRACDVILVTRHPTFGVGLPEPASTAQAARDRIAGHPGFELIADAVLTDIGEDGVGVEFLGSGRTRRVVADTVVMVGAREPNREVAEVITEVFEGEVHVIGDASVPGRLRTAVLDGATVGRSI